MSESQFRHYGVVCRQGRASVAPLGRAVLYRGWLDLAA